MRSRANRPAADPLLENRVMKHPLVAPSDGAVAKLNASAGTQEQVEALLAQIEAEKD